MNNTETYPTQTDLDLDLAIAMRLSALRFRDEGNTQHADFLDDWADEIDPYPASFVSFKVGEDDNWQPTPEDYVDPIARGIAYFVLAANIFRLDVIDEIEQGHRLARES